MARRTPETEALAVAAWEEFYRRKVGYVFVCARNGAGAPGDPADAEVLAREVLEDIYWLAECYMPGSVNGWLATIVANRLIDAHRAREAVAAKHLSSDAWAALLGGSDDLDDETTARVRAVLLRVLTPLEFDVLRFCYGQWYDTSDGALHPPRGEAKAFADGLKRTTGSVRKIRERAREKAAKALMEEFPE